MLEGKEFKEWIEASHVFFKIFEGRYDAYPLAKKWAQEWFSFKEFSVFSSVRCSRDRATVGDTGVPQRRNER